MFISDFYMALLVGLALSLLVTELFGVNPGGIIVPGYLAVVCDTPSVIVLVLLISFMVFGFAKYIMPKFMVIYGRRRFAALLFLAVLLKLALEFIFPIVPFVAFEFRGIGVVVPALIANCFLRQGVNLTLVSMIPTTLATFGIITLAYFFI
ncbi:MAG: poly-gamma-glutamate biosynthesis protein PgsC [Peptococcaceae bacterium]|nr:poly-gamma-glutamate biosynthesis protein PgsC [Peptococcaceae bacterium]